VAITKTHGVIVAAVAHEKNLYDAHTLPEVLGQAEAITDTRARAPSWIAVIAGANLLTARKSWCREERQKDSREQRVQRCENAFIAERLLSQSLATSNTTFGSCAASLRASKAISSI
jgi:hypothetical protein